MSRRRNDGRRAARGKDGQQEPRRGARRPRPERPRDVFVPRPFAGLTDEPEWIAMRELVPAATAPLALRPELVEQYGDRPVTLATLLPMAWPAMARPDGQILIGLQRQFDSGDPNRDLAAAILAALAAEPGQPDPAGQPGQSGPVMVPDQPGEGPRLADVIVDGELDITLHEGFHFWLDGETDDPTVTASLERANGSIYPTVRLAAARAAYWCQVPERAHVRWVLAEPEEVALTALARLRAGGGLKLREDTKFAGMFRAQGLLAPVWDLPREVPAAQWEEPLAAFAKRYADALTIEGDLPPEVRRARQGLIGRQLTLR